MEGETLAKLGILSNEIVAFALFSGVYTRNVAERDYSTGGFR